MDFGFSDEQRMLRDTVRKLLQKHAPPEYVRKHDRERTYPEELFQACAEAGHGDVLGYRVHPPDDHCLPFSSGRICGSGNRIGERCPDG